jgi:zinc transport system ATP-binding protein
MNTAPEATEEIMRLENVSKNLENKLILDNISFNLKRGEINTVIGPNGAGKTTLARIILGVLSPDSGNVVKEKTLRTGYIPQNLNLGENFPLNVKSLISFIALRSLNTTEINELLDIFNAADLIDQEVKDLSGGQLQKVLLAASLANKPELLVLDEPLTGMDVHAEIEFYKTIDELRRTRNLTVLMISHDIHTVMKRSDQVLCLNRHLCCYGTPENVSSHEEYKHLFGDKFSEIITPYFHSHDHKHN